MDTPKLSTAIWLSIVCVIWVCVSILLYLRIGDDWILVLALVMIGFIWIVAAGVTWAYWIWFSYNQRDLERRRVSAITPMTEAANTIMRMSREQLDFLKLNGYYAMKGKMLADKGPIEIFISPRGNMPWEAAVRELRASTVLGLRPTRETRADSPEREWRKLFTAYCIDMGLAIPAEGPYAARWVDRNARAILAGRMGVSLYEPLPENGDEEDE